MCLKRVYRYAILSLLAAVTVTVQAQHLEAEDAIARAPHSDLQAAVEKVDVTPPIGMPLAGYGDRTGGSTGVRDPLRAGVLVLDNGEARAAIVTLDFISIGYDETAAIREAIASSAGIPPDHILVNASHTHGSPRPDIETDYTRVVVAKLAGAAAAAAGRLQPVTIGFEEDEITFCVNRRLVVESGVAEMMPNPDGPVDRRVRVLRFDAGEPDPLAVVMHTACHANVFRNENTRVTADFPGVGQQFVEDVYGGRTSALFMQGAAGDARPNLASDEGWFRNADEADVTWVGRELGASVVASSARAGIRDALVLRDSTYEIRVAVKSIELPGKEGSPVRVDLQALRVGRNLFLTIPGEPFIAFQEQAEDALTTVEIAANAPVDVDRPLNVFVLGYSNGSIGYVCTEEAYQYGGYEPGVSRLSPEAEHILTRELVSLGRSVL